MSTLILVKFWLHPDLDLYILEIFFYLYLLFFSLQLLVGNPFI